MTFLEALTAVMAAPGRLGAVPDPNDGDATPIVYLVETPEGTPEAWANPEPEDDTWPLIPPHEELFGRWALVEIPEPEREPANEDDEAEPAEAGAGA